MRLSRSVSAGTASTIEVPGTTLVGSARKRFRVAASQVSFESRSAVVYENWGALAAARPMMPINDGPCAPPLSPDSAV